MAFASIGGTNTAQSTTANQSTAAVTSITASAGDLLIMLIGVDNNQTTDGDEGAVSSVTDSVGGNTWTKGKEFCNGQGAAQAGTTVSMWYSVITNALSGATVTFNLTNNTARDATAITGHRFSIGAGSTVAIEGTPGTLANDAADPGSLDVTTSNIACLRVRAISSESSTATALTATGGWSKFNETNTASGGSAANQGIRCEYLISTATGAASDPTLFSADHASVYVAFKEIVAAARTPKNIPMTMQPFLAQ